MKKIIGLCFLCMMSNVSGQLTVAVSPGYGDNMMIIGESDKGIYVMNILPQAVFSGAVDKNTMKPLKIIKPKKSFDYTPEGKSKMYYNLKNAFVLNNVMYGLYHRIDSEKYKNKGTIPVEIYLFNINELNIKDPKGMLLDEVKVGWPSTQAEWYFSLDRNKGLLHYGNKKKDGIHVYSILLSELRIVSETTIDFGLKEAFDPYARFSVSDFLHDDNGNFMTHIGYHVDKQNFRAILYGDPLHLEEAKLYYTPKTNVGMDAIKEIAIPTGSFNNRSRNWFNYFPSGKFPRIPNGFPIIIEGIEIYHPTDREISQLGVTFTEKMITDIYTYREDEFKAYIRDSTLNGFIMHYVNKDKNGEFEICFELYADCSILRTINTIANGNPYFHETFSKGLVFCKIGKNGEVLKYQMIPRDVKDSYSFHYFYNNQHYFFYNKTIRKENGKVSSSVARFTVTVMKDDWQMEELPYEATHLTNESKGTVLNIGPEFGYVSNNGRNVYFLGQCETVKSGSSVLLMKYEMK